MSATSFLLNRKEQAPEQVLTPHKALLVPTEFGFSREPEHRSENFPEISEWVQHFLYIPSFPLSFPLPLPGIWRRFSSRFTSVWSGCCAPPDQHLLQSCPAMMVVLHHEPPPTLHLLTESWWSRWGPAAWSVGDVTSDVVSIKPGFIVQCWHHAKTCVKTCACSTW